MANANIFAQYVKPVRSMAEYGADYDAAEGNKLALAAKRMQMQQAERSMADESQARSIAMGAGGDPNKLVQAYKAAGRWDLAAGIEKSIAEQLKGKSDLDTADVNRKKALADVDKDRFAIASQKIDIAGKAFGFVRDNPSAENAQRVVQSLMEGGIWNQQQAEKAMAEIQANPTPEAIKALATQAFQQTLATKDQLTNYMQQNRGGTQAVVGVNPVTGQTSDVQSAQVTQTPDSIARSEDAKQARAQAERASLRSDERARENTAATLTKPFEVTGPDGTPILVQQDKQGNIKPVQGYGPKTGTNKPLPPAVVKNITEARDNAATIDRLKSSFKDDFASKGVLGMGSDVSLMAKGVVGTDGDAVEWWKNYRKQAELVERHALFGAALTPTEQASWRSADIGPGMDAEVIKRNLATRAQLTKQISEMAAQDQIDAGHSAERIKAISGRGDPKQDGPVDFGSLK